jgi:hypothetical protein
MENEEKSEFIKCPFCGKLNYSSLVRCTCGYYFKEESYKSYRKNQDDIEDYNRKTDKMLKHFSMERFLLKTGIIGGILIMLVSCTWFYLAYESNRFYIYPPILFVIGLIALMKGIISRIKKKKTDL